MWEKSSLVWDLLNLRRNSYLDQINHINRFQVGKEKYVIKFSTIFCFLPLKLSPFSITYLFPFFPCLWVYESRKIVPDSKGT